MLGSTLPHDETEEEAWHDDVPQAQHGEVASVLVGREDQLACQATQTT